ncbi:MAG: metallophosphoesterase [Novosphingobium sp.]|nr:metallophosphoesterase [Novosphingobium sp.]
MKFVYFSDSHIAGKNSVNRLGDYFSDCMAKLDECITIYKKEKCSFMIIGGDIFNSNTVSNSVVDEFLDRIEKNNINVKVIYGNHDLVNCNLEMSKSTSLAHMMRRSKNITLLDEYEDNTCFIKGINYKHNIEEDFCISGLNCKETDKFKIIIPHAFISLKEFPFATHIVASKLKTNADVVLCSHFHHDWGIETVNNVKFVNLGAFGRLSIAEHGHMPKIALVDTQTRLIDIIQLSSAKKGSEIFDLSKYNEKKAEKKDISAFIEALNSVEWQDLSTRDQIIKAGKDNNIEQPVIDYLINQLDKLRMKDNE